jgi:hypothetical protein
VCCGDGWHVSPRLAFYFHFRHTWTIAALPIVSSSPTLSTHQTRPSTPCTCTTIFIFASTQQDQLRKKPRKFAHIPHLFSRRHADQETQSSPAKECAFPPALSPTFFFSHFLFRFFLKFYPSSRHESASFIPCHRPARGALRPPTRIDARMLGSHERRQINRGMSRACPDSL